MHPRRLIPIVFILAAACSRSGAGDEACAPHPRGSRPARPAAVLIDYLPLYGGSDLPLFILYDDGRVIYRGGRRGHAPAYREARVDPRSALARFGIGRSVFDLHEKYDYKPEVSDQQTIYLFAWCGDRMKRVAVRAGMVGEGRFSPRVPAPFREAYRRMAGFSAADSRPWFPDTLEVAAWDYDHAPNNPPQEWPAGWPGLASPGTRREPDEAVGEVFFISLPGSQEPRLDSLLANRRKKQAVRISGRKMTVDYRPVLPGEQRWRRFLQHLEM